MQIMKLQGLEEASVLGPAASFSSSSGRCPCGLFTEFLHLACDRKCANTEFLHLAYDCEGMNNVIAFLPHLAYDCKCTNKVVASRQLCM